MSYNKTEIPGALQSVGEIKNVCPISNLHFVESLVELFRKKSHLVGFRECNPIPGPVLQ
jgi:hypothetical protein